MKVLKKMVIMGLYLLFFLILLDFVPVKFAVKVEDAKKNLKDGYYICNLEAKIASDTGWNAKKSTNEHLDEDFLTRAFGNSPEKVLSEKTFNFRWFEIENAFLLKGKVEKLERNPLTLTMDLYLFVNDWEIIYPIKRGTIRQYYAPRRYLTIYDYDWQKVIRSLLK